GRGGGSGGAQGWWCSLSFGSTTHRGTNHTGSSACTAAQRFRRTADRLPPFGLLSSPCDGDDGSPRVRIPAGCFVNWQRWVAQSLHLPYGTRRASRSQEMGKNISRAQ